MAKNKQRKKGSSRASTKGSKAQTAASPAGAKVTSQSLASHKGGKKQAAASQSVSDSTSKLVNHGGKAKAAGSKAGAKASMLPSMSRRNALRAVVASVVVVGAGTAIHKHDVQARDLHDLSAIGEGKPAVVQIHDPSCPLCRRLMGATRKAIEDFPGVAYRVADITTNEGKSFQAQYDVPNVTLLLFDEQGSHLETLNGVRAADELRELFAQTFGESAMRAAESLS